MPNIILPASFIALLLEFRAVFTRPSFDNFVVLASGAVHALGKHRVTDMLRAAGGGATKHFCSYYRFFSHARWSLDELGLVLLGLIIKAFPAAVVELALDDTLTRHTGKKIALASIHADPLLKQRKGRLFWSYGHVFVVLAVHVELPVLGRTGWALPFMFRLYEGPSSGGRADSPSDVRRKAERRRAGKSTRNRVRLTDWVVDEGAAQPGVTRVDDAPLEASARRTKLQLATEMLLLVATRFPDVSFRVVADHLYNGRNVLKPVHEQTRNVTIIARGRKDAALYELPPARRPGQRGRPRVRGARLPNPEQWAAENDNAFRTTTVTMYGREVPVEVASFLGMAYRSLPGRLLRYVIVRDPQGVYRTDYFLATDTGLTEEQVLKSYSHRWPLERAFQDSKQKLGIQDPQVQRPKAVRRAAPFGMLIYSLVVLWYLIEGRKLVASLSPRTDPWYPGNPRPSFTDMIAGLRRLSWTEPFLDPPSEGATRQEILAAYLARVVAAA